MFAVAVLTHYEILEYWFTGIDTLTLIETSRVTTVADAVANFTKPLMHGTNFVALAGLFYRPLTNFSYAFDYWLWGLNPFGYHLTDLLLHGTAAVLVFGLIDELTDDTLAAVLGGGLFALHPATAEIVPAPARRADTLATIFVVFSVLLFIRGLDTTRRRSYLAGSVFAYLLALGSKEIAVILPPLVVTWFVLTEYATTEDWGETLRTGTAIIAPYASVTTGYFAVRFAVLGGIGGYVGPFSPASGDPVTTVAAEYLLSLLYPIDYIEAILSYDLQFVPSALYVFVGVIAVLSPYAVYWANGLRSLCSSKLGRSIVFFGAWLAVPLILYIRLGTYSDRNGYVSIIPVVAVLALLFVVAVRESLDGVSLPEAGTSTVLIVAGLLTVSLVAGSPLVRSYDRWEHNGEVTREALQAAANETDNLSANAVIGVVGLPRSPEFSSPTTRARAKTANHFWAHTITAWLRLQKQGCSVTTYKAGPVVVMNGNIDDVRMTISREKNQRFPRMYLRYTTSASENDTTANRDLRTSP